MSKINTIEQLTKKIDKEMAWRKKDLSGIKFDLEAVQFEKDNKTKERYIKYGIVILYSHWEGAVKNIAEYYLNFVSCQKLRYSDLKKNFLMLGIKNLIDETSKTKKSTKRTELIETVFSKQNEESKIPINDIISAKSNLNFEILREILITIGISIEPFSIYEVLIDEKLLQNRNFIAHGDHFNRLDGVVTIEDFKELHEKIRDVIELFSNTIIDAARNEEYKNKEC
ncbi:hypothetical protein HMPREF2780_02290 [Streptococcus sp. HMSC062B01]|jgi:hypothetical protein|uniref:MAE_28990/MAE_18760 family HEPN-like nuclease n=1 Tax=Streptococcus sp. HMSC062B01 TaxID=1739284 RepID=UPI0008C72DE1|nr:MAE_28990/MAE_18760 family HEPN-like nuclease [Streptococcus sp. HMSC062B01]OFL22304.1 hypothetical protein HMPREF2780_02290 [Streptococcus sp. HMSC062B01]